MNVYWMLLSWIGFGCCILLLILARLLRSFIRISNPFPEDITLLLRSLEWEDVKTAFDLKDAQDDVFPAPDPLRSFEFRIAVCREYLQRMEHNAWIVQQCAKADLRDNMIVVAEHEQEKQTILAEAQAMLDAAGIHESDSRLPEFDSQAGELRSAAAALILKAKELHILVRTMAEEDQVLPARTTEALQAAERFRSAVRLHLFKLSLLTFVLHFDKMRLTPMRWALAAWHRGNDDLLRLYEETRIKAAAYLLLYHDDRSLALM